MRMINLSHGKKRFKVRVSPLPLILSGFSLLPVGCWAQWTHLFSIFFLLGCKWSVESGASTSQAQKASISLWKAEKNAHFLGAVMRNTGIGGLQRLGYQTFS